MKKKYSINTEIIKPDSFST